MHIFITGATGLIGKALSRKLIAQGHHLTALNRSAEQASQVLPPAVKIVTTLSDYTDFNGFDAVINLAGEPIFDRRWTTPQKSRLKNSRITLTENLVALINRSSRPPHTFISGSATGYYGHCQEELIDESHSAAQGFAAQLCQQWEQAAQQADTRVCILRTGIVISPHGGALAKILPLYRLGLGGKLGNGRQYWGWIALEDMVDGILFLLQHPQCQGPFNLVSPLPIRNSEFNQTLGKILRRPHFVAVPAFVLRILLGERVCLLLDSQRVVPNKLMTCGFTFRFAELDNALVEALQKH